MTRAVFDCSVVLSALGWAGNPRYCLDLVYAGQVLLYVTTAIWQEYEEKIPVILAEKQRPVDTGKELARLLKVVYFVEAYPLGKQRCRDLKDDRYLAAALSAQAVAVVTNDRDLLVLKKPFRIAMMTPIEFIKMIRSI